MMPEPANFSGSPPAYSLSLFWRIPVYSFSAPNFSFRNSFGFSMIPENVSGIFSLVRKRRTYRLITILSDCLTRLKQNADFFLRKNAKIQVSKNVKYGIWYCISMSGRSSTEEPPAASF